VGVGRRMLLLLRILCGRLRSLGVSDLDRGERVDWKDRGRLMRGVRGIE
jgi:hypothetical protein